MWRQKRENLINKKCLTETRNYDSLLYKTQAKL